MRRLLLALLVLAPLQAFAFGGPAVSELLRHRLEDADSDGVRIGHERVAVHPDLLPFYAARGYAQAWAEHGATFATTLRDLDRDGLDPEQYRLRRIELLLAAGAASADETADLDLLLTDAFFRAGEHLLRGRVDPSTLSEDWFPTLRQRDLRALLDTALATGDLAGAFDQLRPRHPDYWRLREALARYRDLADRAGNLPPILPAGPIEPGGTSTRVPLVRQRLALFGDYAAPEPPDSLRLVYDPALIEAVQRFQARHGLEADGVIGQATRTALNASTDGWVRALELNLERWRWLPDDLGTRHVFVNIPGYWLRVREHYQTALEMKVIVGLPSWQTPVFSDSIQTVIFNPTWGVPPSIAAAETIPLVRSQGAEYLTSRGFQVYRRGERVDPTTVDWAQARAGEYYFIQSPGAANPLGELKVEFPNPHDIYIHDTNQRRLFGRERRALSHGCIRAEEPRALAEYLLTDIGWTAETVEASIRRGQIEYMGLLHPMPVHLTYFTAWVDAEGGVAFYDDVYGHDAKLAEALGLD